MFRPSWNWHPHIILIFSSKAPTYLRSAVPFSLHLPYSMSSASTGDLENSTSTACKVTSVDDRKGAKYQSRKEGTALNLWKGYIIWVFDNREIQAAVPHFFTTTNLRTKDVRQGAGRHDGRQESEQMLKGVVFRSKEWLRFGERQRRHCFYEKKRARIDETCCCVPLETFSTKQRWCKPPLHPSMIVFCGPWEILGFRSFRSDCRGRILEVAALGSRNESGCLQREGSED